jgi:hypothetical protein
MLGINGVAGNLQKIYTAVMEKGSVPILGRKGDYRRECCAGGGGSSVQYLTQR